MQMHLKQFIYFILQKNFMQENDRFKLSILCNFNVAIWIRNTQFQVIKQTNSIRPLSALIETIIKFINNFFNELV